ncbi:CLUMA_CG015952, isoform A [Clunio marinus]|uniref:CLUMA_CG015952, isoform A n=1 Tax=Clunio marinus TaxID=568069 RepID=A0A1J1ISD8_9DIPT|nr:CLUMA_CG015952, isoform A [Clunio marinus]
MLSAKREPRKILLCFNCDSGMVEMSFFLAHAGTDNVIGESLSEVCFYDFRDSVPTKKEKDSPINPRKKLHEKNTTPHKPFARSFMSREQLHVLQPEHATLMAIDIKKSR